MKYNKEILNRFLTNKVAIAVRTSEEWDKFMQLLEEETDVKWLWGKNPTGSNEWHEYSNNSAIDCGYARSNKLGYSNTTFYRDEGYEIIEFKELIKGEEEMAYTGQNYRDLFVKTKIEGFVNSQWNFDEYYKTYKGYLNVDSYKLEEYFDFLAEMKTFGIERDEIEQIIIKDYLTEKESENNESRDGANKEA